MRSLGKIALTIGLLIVGGIVWYNLAYPIYTYRIRLTVAVDGKERSGSSVIEIAGATQPQIGGAPAIFYRYKGDAAFVDLGDGRQLIATLGYGSNGSGDPLYSVAPALFGVGGKDIASGNADGGRRIELPRNLVPTLVTFADPQNAATVRVVEPGELEQAFGFGVHFKSVWIELTNDPVSRGIEGRLPWIARMKADGLGGRIISRPGEFTVNVPYFTRD